MLLSRKKHLLKLFSPKFYPALLWKESRFPAFLYSFRRSRGRSPSLQAPENHFRRNSTQNSFEFEMCFMVP